MFLGTYWPRSPEMDNCSSKGRLIGRVFGTGEKSARELLDCWTHSPMMLSGGGKSDSAKRYESQKCITESCPKASAQLSDLLSGQVDPSTVDCD